MLRGCKWRRSAGVASNYPADPPTQAIVDDAVANADVLGAAAARSDRRRRSSGPSSPTAPPENRGGESTLGNLVAEVQRWATRNPESGAAQIAFMNPGGLRADMVGAAAAGDPYPRTLTYKQAADVQPFANTLVNMDLTGAQIKAVLEQQWQPRRCVAAVPAARHLEGLHLHLRRRPQPRGLADHGDVAQRRADRAGARPTR